MSSKSRTTIDFLCLDELTLVLRHLSVTELYHCLHVCPQWHSTIRQLLSTQKSVTLCLNDISHYTNEELSEKCDNKRHLAVNSSVGRLIKSKQSLLSAITTPKFKDIQNDLFPLLTDFCPNIQSLDISQYLIGVSDMEQILAVCPRLQCLYVYSEDRDWIQFLSPTTAGLKHFSLKLSSETPIYGVRETPFDVQKCQMSPQIEDLVLIRPHINAINLDILCRYLQSFGCQLKKLHLIPGHKISANQCYDLIRAITPNESNISLVKNWNINVFVFNGLFKEMTTKLPNIETLYLHFNTESEQNDSLKNLKKLKEIYLDFNSNVNEFAFDSSEAESDVQFIELLPKMPSTLTKLTLYDATLSLTAFLQAITYFPDLQQLVLNWVYIENNDIEHNFWQVISNFKNLWSLTLESTNITDEGLEALIGSDSLTTLELVNYKGTASAHTLIDSYKVIEVFGQLATLRPDRWFHLRLDVDVFKVNHQIRAKTPRNVKLVNIGYEK